MQSIAVLEKRLEPVNGGADAASIKHSVEACSLPFCRRASAGVRLIREHQATGKCSLGHGQTSSPPRAISRPRGFDVGSRRRYSTRSTVLAPDDKRNFVDCRRHVDVYRAASAFPVVPSAIAGATPLSANIPFPDNGNGI